MSFGSYFREGGGNGGGGNGAGNYSGGGNAAAGSSFNNGYVTTFRLRKPCTREVEGEMIINYYTW